ncbi:uroporphyrinogen decarboxylase [Methylohalomonas lacus]|uniref:Uroporphyrinogen decarboxylase n=1 Tax=Methylohalomonas lacus TaxID=398773 RepID=A0AAE3HKQ7_9GAMM|nr:uroporphyrinogen decarboxylase [Methylohalomonas lacus]MCS3904131.1 uroporphyrinogen decarboxylase [Methylohalomonas lacus]
MPGNDRLIRALLRQPVDRTPVWIMRQAGRYLPEYRATREKAGDFLTLCKTPELACEVTLQPLERFDLDAAILFSDILTIPDAMGLGLSLVEKQGPQFARTVRSAAEVKALPALDPDTDLGYVMEAIRLIKRELNGRVPLIGFAGSPWTLATYMIEGASSREYSRSKTLLYNEPRTLRHLLDKLSIATRDYLNAQIEAGVDAVMIFDSWAGVLTPQAYRDFSLVSLQNIVDGLVRERDGQRIPVTIFSKGAAHSLGGMANSGCDALGLDWTFELGIARALVGDRVALQGNLDPAILRAESAAIREQVAKVLASFGSGTGHVFNLGHGITPDIDPDHVAAMVDAVHELSPAYHDD